MISQIDKFHYLMHLHNKKFILCVYFPHLPIWLSKPIYHITSFRNMKNLIAPCNFTMRNFFWPLDVTKFDMSHWSIFNFAAQVAGWCASPILLYAKRQSDNIISWVLGLVAVDIEIILFWSICFYMTFAKINPCLLNKRIWIVVLGDGLLGQHFLFYKEFCLIFL